MHLNVHEPIKEMWQITTHGERIHTLRLIHALILWTYLVLLLIVRAKKLEKNNAIVVFLDPENFQFQFVCLGYLHCPTMSRTIFLSPCVGFCLSVHPRNCCNHAINHFMSIWSYTELLLSVCMKANYGSIASLFL